jgi:hypothetical protein
MSEVKAMKQILMLGVVISLGLGLNAQSFVVLHEFTDGADGASPLAGLTMDPHGNLYGTAASGGNYGPNCTGSGCGTVFKLKHLANGWIFTPLYAFMGGNDSSGPIAPLTIGPNGTFYGVTEQDPLSCIPNCGTVFNITPSPNIPSSAFAPWLETVLYGFRGGLDGALPFYGAVVFDQAGNLYGATGYGGNSHAGLGCAGGCGTIYELSPSGDHWTETILYNFTGTTDGAVPIGVVFDNAGNLYGITYTRGAYNCGTVFKLTRSGSGWSESTIYSFNPGVGDGCNSVADLTFDGVSNFYGTTYAGASGSTAFQLSPNGQAGWTETVIASFGYGVPSWGGLTLDSAGNLYGVTGNGIGERADTLYKLTPSNGGWNYTALVVLSGSPDPVGNVTLDTNGNIYGITAEGGMVGGSCQFMSGCGTVWEYTP